MLRCSTSYAFRSLRFPFLIDKSTFLIMGTSTALQHPNSDNDHKLGIERPNIAICMTPLISHSTASPSVKDFILD